MTSETSRYVPRSLGVALARTALALTALALTAFAPRAELAAQQLPVREFTALPTDSIVSFSAGMRRWPRLTDDAQAPAVGTRVGYRARFLRFDLDLNAVALAREGQGAVPPYLLDGSARVTSAPVRVGGVMADLTLAAHRDAIDPRSSWIQQVASGRIWRGGPSAGLWGGIEFSTARDPRATPAATELELGAWKRLGGVHWSLGARTTRTEQLVLLGDSSGVDPATCYLDYDPDRPIQQYRSVCPKVLEAVDLGMAVEWGGASREYRVFSGHRLSGGAIREERRESWIGGSFAQRLSPSMSFVVSGERRPTDVVRGVESHTRFTLGLRLFPLGAFDRARERDIEAPANAPSRVARTLVLEVAGAERVEVRGDLTEWRIEDLVVDRDGKWRLLRDLAPGRYALEMRVNGGDWQPPPGLPVTDDGFGGRVGILVIEAR